MAFTVFPHPEQAAPGSARSARPEDKLRGLVEGRATPIQPSSI
jgi:hypothetical protein